ncbi:hypothetical protein P7C73_g5711, partial [Tremellales sp. Uapishka_1]
MNLTLVIAGLRKAWRDPHPLCFRGSAISEDSLGLPLPVINGGGNFICFNGEGGQVIAHAHGAVPNGGREREHVWRPRRIQGGATWSWRSSPTPDSKALAVSPPAPPLERQSPARAPPQRAPRLAVGSAALERASEGNDPALARRHYSQLKLLQKNWDGLRGAGEGHNRDVIANLEACLKGELACPERPVILSNYIYVGFHFQNYSPGGEMIWLGSVIPVMESAGYTILHAHEYHQLLQVSHLIPDLVHMYWTDERRTLACLYDPRCIADYQPTDTGPDLSIDVPLDERGAIPLSRLFTMTWWGTIPESWGNGFTFVTGHYGDQRWTYNPLGQQWAMSPYAYPNNTYLPWSIEEVCTQTAFIPHDERKDIALVFAKHSRECVAVTEGYVEGDADRVGAGIFYNNQIKPTFWDTPEVRAQNFTFLSTAGVVEDHAIPDGLESIGAQTRDNYNALLASVKAVVGLGVPTISPTVYGAMCQGTPVVIPRSTDDPQISEKDLWGIRYSQHPMALHVGPPHIFPYLKDSEESLLQAVNQAMNVSPGRYIPPNMRLPYVTETILSVLATDFDAMAAKVIQNNGGQVPRAEEKVRQHIIDAWGPHSAGAPGTPIKWEEWMLEELDEDEDE